MEQNLLETLLNSMLNPVFYKDRKGVFKGCNEIFQKQILGLAGEEIIGHSLPDIIGKILSVFSRAYPEEDLNILKEYMESCHRKDMELLDKGASEIKEVDFFCADGIKRTFLANRTSYFSPEGEVLGMVCVLQDITAIKQAQENAKKSEARYRMITEQTGQLLFEECVKTGKINWKGAIEGITGYTPEEFKNIDISAFSELIHPDDREKVLGKLYQSYESGERFNGEFRFRRKDGTYTYLEGSAAFLKDSNECVFRSLGVLKDISESKLAREELKKSEERFLTVAEYTGQLVFDYDLLSGKNNCAGAIENLTGYSPEEYQAFDIRYWAEHVHPEDREYILGVHKKFLESGEMQQAEYRFKKKDGTYIDVEDQVVGLKDEKGRVWRILGTMKDVTERNLALTERKLAEEELARSEERYRLIAERTGLLLYHENYAEGRVDVGGAIRGVMGYNSDDAAKFCEEEWIRLVHPDDREEVGALHERCKEEGGSFHAEYRMRRKDGTYFCAEDEGVYLLDENGRVCKAVGVIKDVTEKKKAEEALAKIEEVRKKEIHHRIKNNLQVISSLLSLQADHFEDRKVKEAFMESQDRVISMSLIHEELYKSVDLETLDFIAYLRKLTGELLSSYSLDSSLIRLIMDTEEHIYLGMDCAIPLGMIINELVTNSLKHAFPEEREGEIRIEFNRTQNSSTSSQPLFTLVVSDNGSGFSEKVDFENSDTLGFQLVNALVKQIEGEVELKRNHGTEFRINF